MGNGSVAIFIFNSIVPVIAMGVLTNTSFTSGAATKVLALLIFIVGIMWFVFGATLAQRLNSGYTNFSPSAYGFKRYAENPNRKGSLAGGLFAGIFLDRAVANVMINNLPFPMNYFYWMGMWPMVPLTVFGLLPAILTWSSMGSLMALAAVMDAGGDGTEYVEAKKIHWFYSLSPKDRERVREGSDLEDGEDSDSDSSEGESDSPESRSEDPDDVTDEDEKGYDEEQGRKPRGRSQKSSGKSSGRE